MTRNKFWERGRGPALCLITARHHQSFREQFSVKLSETKYLAGVTKKHEFYPYPFYLAICVGNHWFWPSQFSSIKDYRRFCVHPALCFCPHCPGLYKAVCHPLSPVTRGVSLVTNYPGPVSVSPSSHGASHWSDKLSLGLWLAGSGEAFSLQLSRPRPHHPMTLTLPGQGSVLQPIRGQCIESLANQKLGLAWH